VKQKKRLKFASSFTSPDFFFKFFCYEVIVKQKIYHKKFITHGYE